VSRAGVKSPPTFTMAEAAERLGVSRRKLREMIDGGRLRALWLAGAARLTREEVERLERELTLCPPTA